MRQGGPRIRLDGGNVVPRDSLAVAGDGGVNIPLGVRGVALLQRILPVEEPKVVPFAGIARPGIAFRTGRLVFGGASLAGHGRQGRNDR